MASGADKSVFSETDLRQRIRMLEAVADKAPDGLFVKDADGKYRMCNRAAARLVGRAHDQLIGQDDAGLFGVEAAATLAAQDRRVIATGNTEVLETAISADGVTRVLKFTKSPHLDCDGKVVGVIGVIQQVSEKKTSDSERAAITRFCR